jgi:hypothetical protein
MQVLQTTSTVKTEVNKNIPPCPQGLVAYEIEIEGVDLTVHLEYEAEELGSYTGGMQNEPDYPEEVNVHAVYVDGPTNISRLLSDELIHEIQSTYLYSRLHDIEGNYYDI